MDDLSWQAAGAFGVLMGILGWVSKYGQEIYFRNRKETRQAIMEDRKYEASLIAKPTEALIAALQERVKSLESACQRYDGEISKMREAHEQESAELRKQHFDCLEVQADLRAEVAALTEKVAALWRHDAANKQQVEVVKQEIKGLTDRRTGGSE